MRSVEVLVIGGGASGMVAAIEAKRQGAKVMLLEKKKRLGKKLLATGNGKCNYTNRLQMPACYRSNQIDFPWKIIQKFGDAESIRWFDQLGILAKDRDGYVYPASGQAASVLHALEREINRLKIEVHTEEWAKEILVHYQQNSKQKDGFVVSTNQTEYLARKVILSTGGKASPVHGSTGDGYLLAESLGHRLVEPVPALTSLILNGNYMKLWSGVRIQGTVALYNGNDQLLYKDTGEIQMVAYGISGIPVFQLSRFASRERAEGRKVYLILDSMPDYDKDWIYKELIKRKGKNGQQSMGDLLEGMFPDKFAGVLLKQADIPIKSYAVEISDEKLYKLADVIKGMRLSIKATSDFDKAQVTAGGVCTEEINEKTMESKICKGLYLTGELLDVDGICGGYNLQWAWATGYIAGISCKAR